jgi:putative ABC transport system permease protein
MFDLDRWNEIYQTLSRNKLRTFLTAFGVFWGIFMLIIMLGSGQGLQNGVTRMFSGTATNSFFMWAQSTSVPYKGLPRGRHFEFRFDDIKAIREKVPEVQYLSAAAQLGGWRGENNVSRGRKTGAFTVRGDVPEIRFIRTFAITEGRFMNERDMKEKRKICVIGSRVKELLFMPDEDPLGKEIQVSGVYFRVAGCLSIDKAGEDAQEMMQTIFIPITTFQQAFNSPNRVDWFSITSRPDVPASVAEARVGDILKQIHKIAPEDIRAIGSWNTEEEFRKLQGLFTGIRILVWVVGIGTLLAGVIGVSNIMLIVVRERTREIGIRRAIGATPFSIMSQVMMESVMLTLLAGYLGLISGIYLLELVSSLLSESGEGGGMFYNPGVELGIALKALAVLVVCGLFAGIIPARRAVDISPVNALRSE